MMVEYNTPEDYFAEYAKCQDEHEDVFRDDEYPEMNISFNRARGIWKVWVKVSTESYSQVGFGATLKAALNDIRDQTESDDGWSAED